MINTFEFNVKQIEVSHIKLYLDIFNSFRSFTSTTPVLKNE